jgi:hypothetical protein
MLIIGTIAIDLYDNVVAAYNEGNLEYALDNHDYLVVLFYWDTAVYTFSVVFSSRELRVVVYQTWHRMVSVSFVKQYSLIRTMAEYLVWIYLYFSRSSHYHLLRFMSCQRICRR